MKKITLVLSLVMFSLFGKATFYVVPGGAGAMNGTSWTDAYGDIQTAINAASTLYGTSLTAQEVWIKTGTYSTSTAALIMKESVSIYGGFAGTETDKSQRGKGANAWNYTSVTTLDGGGGTGKRCIEVAANLTNVTVIDGFTITNGNGVGVQLNASGGGVLIRGNLKLQNCIVTGNTTSGNGGGVNSTGGIVSNCWIYSNSASAGGGMYSNPSTGITTSVDNCLIERNTAATGGGFRFQGAGVTETVDRCIIRNNFSTGNGAGVYVQGTPVCTITNSLITNNSGGNAVYLISTKLINSTIANNEGGVYLATASSGELYNNIIVNNVSKGTTSALGVSVTSGYAAGKVKNNAIWPSVAYQTWGGATDSILTTTASNAYTQVSFKSPTAFRGRVLANADSLSQISAADWTLNNTSICLNKGDNSFIPSGITTDFAGLSRTQGTFVDLGAYELPYYNTTVTFNANGTVNSYTSGDIDSEPQGTQLAFTITPTGGYKITSVLYNGTDVTSSLVGNVYTAPALSADATLVVQFDLGTGLQNAQTGFQCFSADKQVQLRNVTPGDEVTIYSITGSKVKSEKAYTSAISISLPQGIYMVKVANQIDKIVIR